MRMIWQEGREKNVGVYEQNIFTYVWNFKVKKLKTKL